MNRRVFVMICISSIIKLHGTKERTIPSLSKNVVWWLMGAWWEGGGGGDKKNQSWPGAVQFKICSEYVLLGHCFTCQ